jgi:hypothetical protein
MSGQRLSRKPGSPRRMVSVNDFIRVGIVLPEAKTMLQCRIESFRNQAFFALQAPESVSHFCCVDF